MNEIIDSNILDKWRDQYGGIYIVNVFENDSSILTGYFKKPSKELRAFCIEMSNTSLCEAQTYLYQNTYIGGNPKITTNEAAALAGMCQLWLINGIFNY